MYWFLHSILHRQKEKFKSKMNQFILGIYNKCILFFPGKILLRLQIRDNVEGNAK